MSHKLLGLCEEAACVVFLLVTDPRLPFYPLACRDGARCCYRRRGRARARGRRSALCTVGCSCCRLGAEDELCDSQTMHNFSTSARDQTTHLQRRVLNLVFIFASEIQGNWFREPGSASFKKYPFRISDGPDPNVRSCKL